MAFDEVRLPEDIEQGARGGPEFSTTVIELSSGREQRNQNWSQARQRWDLSYGFRSSADYASTRAFWYARKGRARGFRFKDWSDYQVLADDQFGTGDAVETDFQLTKTYTDSGGGTYVRTITKPVSGTLTIKVDSATQTEGALNDYTVDYTTGVVTFNSAPGDTLVIEWQGEFDVPVRFDTDWLEQSILHTNALEFPSVPIVELRQ